MNNQSIDNTEWESAKITARYAVIYEEPRYWKVFDFIPWWRIKQRILSWFGIDWWPKGKLIAYIDFDEPLHEELSEIA